MSADKTKHIDIDPTLGREQPEQGAESALDLDESTRSLLMDVSALERGIAELPKHSQPNALHGISKKASLKPALYPVISITIPRKNLGALNSAIKDIALPCNTNLVGSDEDETITVNYIVPTPNESRKDPRNIHHIKAQLEHRGIPGKISIGTQQMVMLGSSQIPLTSLTTALTVDTEIPAKGVVAKYDNGDNTLERTSPLTLDKPADPFELTHLASPSSLKEARKLNAEIPREGECVYLMVDLNFVDNHATPLKDPTLLKLVEEIDMLGKPEFTVSVHNGYLTIVGIEERAGSSLTAMAYRLWRTNQDLKLVLGNGEIQHQNTQQFTIKNLPKIADMKNWRKARSRIYLTDDFDEHMHYDAKIHDPTQKRDASLCHIKTEESGIDGLRALTYYEPRVDLEVGGPDRVIGAKEPFDAIREATTDEETKLTIIAGAAGMGKSRLIGAALQELPANHKPVICSVDPAGKNKPGFGLMSVAEQISTQFINANTSHLSAEDTKIIGYNRASFKEKLRIAQEEPGKLVEMCLTALKHLNRGNTVLVIDDLHHADRFSVKHLIALSERYIDEADGKSFLAMRPEEIEQSEPLIHHLEELEENLTTREQ